MKRIIIGLIILLCSCSKEPKIKLNNITQTDGNCNIIGNPVPGQWGINNLSDLNYRDNLIIFGDNSNENGLSSNVNLLNVDLSKYKFDCPVDFNFSLTVCPNPANFSNSDQRIFQNFESDLDISYVFFGTVDRKNRIISTSYGSTISGEQFGGDYFFPNYGQNHTRYYLILTADSCAFFGKGDIIIEK